MQDEFLDRKEETKEVIKILEKSTKNYNRILFISGVSGVGKSSLVKKISKDPALKQTILTIGVSSCFDKTIEDLYYFNKLYKEVVKFAKSRPFYRIPSPVQYSLRSGRNIAKYGFKILKCKIGVPETVHFAEPEEDESIITKKDYLLYILRKSNIIIDIENIQNIDGRSLEFVEEIIRDVAYKTFIFEYTLTQDNEHRLKNMLKEFENICDDTQQYKVKEMDFETAMKLAPQDKHINEDKLKGKYNSSKGNLMEIILADAEEDQCKNESSNQSDQVPSQRNDKTPAKASDEMVSNIDAQIMQLKRNELYLLYIVYLNDALISYDELATMVVENTGKIVLDFKEMDKLLKRLFEKNILLQQGNFIKIKHDSISTALQAHVNLESWYCAYSTIKNYYNNIFENNNQDIDKMEKLLSLYLKFNDQELLKFLPQLKEIVLKMKYTHLIIKKLEYFRTELLNISSQDFPGIHDLTLTMVEICLCKKMGDEAQKNLDLIYDSNNQYHIALQAQIYSLQETMEAHDALVALVDTTIENSRLRLICEICLLYIKTKLFPYSITKEYGEKLVENVIYKQYMEYAYLLRNFAELCDDSTSCTKLYNNAIAIFEERNMHHDVAAVYLSLSMINAYDGNLPTAKEYIEDAEKIDKRELSLCYILNNKSAIELLEESYSDATEKNLRNALLLSESKYEAIIIKSNLLIYYCLKKNFDKARDIASDIENSNYIDFKYEELLHIVYQDLYYFYSVFDFDQGERMHYYEQIESLIDSPQTRESTKLLASGMNHLIEPQSYFAKFPYRVDFLGYWEFTICSDLNC